MDQAFSGKKKPAFGKLRVAHFDEQAAFGAEEIVDHLPIGIFVVDIAQNRQFRCAKVNRIFGALLDLDDPIAAGTLLDANTNDGAVSPLIDHLEKAVSSRCPVTFEWRHPVGGNITYLDCHIVPVADDNGVVRRIVGTMADHTQRRRTERRMLHEALHDSLTNLPNRVLFMDKLEQVSIEAVPTPERGFCLLFINIDRLKIVNESLGHLAGDELLISIATRLQKCGRPQDTLARLGSDEFALLVSDVHDIGEASDIADMIHKRMHVPFNLGGSEVYVSLSIGIAERRGGDTDIESLMSDASLALGKAKSSGRGRTEVYTKSIKQRSKSQLQLETDLRRAIAREEFELHYQPLISLADGKLLGFEALARWHHPSRGMISPTEFIPLAEETGLIQALGKWALREACRQQKDWLDRYPGRDELAVSVNVSSLQFRNEKLVEDTREILADSGLDGRNLKLEITESVIMESPEIATKVLNELKKLGIEFAVDDFGTGYSSLSYLNRFPIDILKIDRSFVSDMHDNEDSYKIVQILASLADTLGLTLVAEGIETERQLDDLRDLGCDVGQGYLFSPPVPADKAEKFISENVSLVPRSTKD